MRMRAFCLFAMVLGAFLVPWVAFAAASPLATTEAASFVGNGVATLNGKVNLHGDAVADCKFEYGISGEYGKTAPCVPSAAGVGEGVSQVEVTAVTEPLEPNTTYHYRLVAVNLGGFT
jgi:hypothetical protein